MIYRQPRTKISLMQRGVNSRFKFLHWYFLLFLLVHAGVCYYSVQRASWFLFSINHKTQGNCKSIEQNTEIFCRSLSVCLWRYLWTLNCCMFLCIFFVSSALKCSIIYLHVIPQQIIVLWFGYELMSEHRLYALSFVLLLCFTHVSLGLVDLAYVWFQVAILL